MAEAYAKSIYPNHFRSKLTDSEGENYETQTWLAFAKSEGYITATEYNILIDQSLQVGRLLSYMQRNPSLFAKSSPKKPSN